MGSQNQNECEDVDNIPHHSSILDHSILGDRTICDHANQNHAICDHLCNDHMDDILAILDNRDAHMNDGHMDSQL